MSVTMDNSYMGAVSNTELDHLRPYTLSMEDMYVDSHYGTDVSILSGKNLALFKN